MPLGFVLTPELVVTIRFSEVKAFDQVKQRFAQQPPPDSATAFVTLIEALVDAGADMLEAFGGQLAQMSTAIFREPELVHGRDKRYARGLRKRLGTVGSLGDDLSQIRQTLLGLQRIVGFVSERAIGGLGEEVTRRLRTATADLASLVEFESHLTDKTQFLL
ncbi:MAG: magnesium transporter CorA, partial [Proteobacteria bacterium]